MSKVAVVGSPRSGKSVYLNAVSAVSGVTVIPACPDGEGPVFHALATYNPTVARSFKEAFKGQFTVTFVSNIVAMLSGITSGAWLVDVGGKRTPENSAILSACDAVVILYRDSDDLAAWEQYIEALGKPVMSRIESNMVGHDSDTACSGMKRGADITSKPAVRALANMLK